MYSIPLLYFVSVKFYFHFCQNWKISANLLNFDGYFHIFSKSSLFLFSAFLHWNYPHGRTIQKNHSNGNFPSLSMRFHEKVNSG